MKWWSAFAALAVGLGFAGTAAAAPLIVDGTNPGQSQCAGGTLSNGGRVCTLGGVRTYDYVDIRNGGVVIVPEYDGNRTTTGQLVLKATGLDPTSSFAIRVDRSSRINAKGSGYQGKLCDNGPGPTAFPLAGGRGGCGVRDSGGGGAFFGRGGRGTKDNPNLANNTGWEEDCLGTVNATNTNCESHADCRNNDALPTVAGQGFVSSIYDAEFGAAGGDKGCRDSGNGGAFGEGLRAGDGGGRVVLFGANTAQNGRIVIEGRVSADGRRGCAVGNDSAGGGAGGGIFIVGDQVSVGQFARVSAHGGRGGDSQPKCLPCAADGDCGGGQTCQTLTDPQSGASFRRCGPCNCSPCSSNAQCNTSLGQTCQNLGGDLGNVCADSSGVCTPFDVGDDERECTSTQNAGLCDDCGGGGGGGLIRVQSRTASLDPRAIFDVRGAKGGICPVCEGEAGGGIGELQLDGAYVGEICDGEDNDFDGSVDEGLPDLSCPSGARPSCVGGVPQDCTYDAATCGVAARDSRPRFALILDSSGSMLNDLRGNPTFGDGSNEFPGVDTSADTGVSNGNDSRLFIAKRAVARVLAAFPESDYALARYYQDVGVNRSCQTASNFECAESCCSYDTPTNNVTPQYPTYYPDNLCELGRIYPGAGYSFANPGNTSSINIGWQTPTTDCINYAGSCGPPRRGAQFLVGFDRPITQYLSWLDQREGGFRNTTAEGDHCSGGDCELRGTGPTPLAGSLQATQSFLTPIATCDSARACRSYATILLTDGVESCQGDPVAAAAALRNAVPGEEIKTYVIGFAVGATERAQLNQIAVAGGTSARDFGGTTDAFFADDENQLANAVASIIASSQVFERCNDRDDDCDQQVDEDFPDKGLACDDGRLGVCRGTGTFVCKTDGTGTECDITNPGSAPGTEVCNGLDDNCNGRVDEGLTCTGCVPALEVCNGKDDDCDRQIDEEPDVTTNDPRLGGPCGTLTPPNDQAPCQLGTNRCINGSPRCVGFVGPKTERCNGQDDDCDGQNDIDAVCPGSTQCREGRCVAECVGGEFPCPGGLVCRDGFCFPVDCSTVTCDPGEVCVSGLCVADPDAGAGGSSGTGGSAGASGSGGTVATDGGAGTSAAGGSAGNAGSAGSGLDGGAGSTNLDPTDDNYLLSTGGGGCACSTAPSRAPSLGGLVAAAALGLVVARRRVRRVRREGGAA
jgi:MYXO-CTERM domain-containing protein